MTAVDKVKEILYGIDMHEIDSDDGWWETSGGVEFGEEKLQEIIELVKELEEYKWMYEELCK